MKNLPRFVDQLGHSHLDSWQLSQTDLLSCFDEMQTQLYLLDYKNTQITKLLDLKLLTGVYLSRVCLMSAKQEREPDSGQ